ncbi:hypothetical protein BJ742DRAFT_573680 [Cladochytrium replicatum]|nr:hypothetical protein BJ742DRAFT_573680 [Cladochytrium replicatum]
MTRILKLTDDEVFSNDLVGLLNPTVRAGSPAAGNPPSPVGRTNRTCSLLSEDTIKIKQSSVKTWRLPTCLSSPNANPSLVSKAHVMDDLGSSLQAHTAIAGTLSWPIARRSRLFASAPRVEPVDSTTRGATGSATFNPLIKESLEVDRNCSLLSEEMAISLVRSTVWWALETAYRTVQLVDFTCSLPTRAAKSFLSVTYKCAEIAGDLFRRVASSTSLKYFALNLF